MNYQNGKIYRIVCNATGKQYIGSTCSPISARLAQHRKSYRKYTQQKFHYITSFEILKEGNYEIILLENCEVENKEQLHKRERHFIETMECVNRQIPTRTHKEYRETHRDELREKHKVYERMHRDEIRKREKEYREKHSEEKSQYNKSYHETHRDELNKNSRIYYASHREEISKQSKVYREDNIDKIHARNNQKFNCECGGTFTCVNKLKHQRTAKHQHFIKQYTKQ